METAERLALWSKILEEIRDKTSLSFKYIEFDTKNEAIAQTILPILASHISGIPDENLRRAIYAKFLTPFAYPYFNSILKWLKREDSESSNSRLNIDCLSQAIEMLVKPHDAKQV